LHHPEFDSAAYSSPPLLLHYGQYDRLCRLVHQLSLN
jgi:hypothetical protein